MGLWWGVWARGVGREPTLIEEPSFSLGALVPVFQGRCSLTAADCNRLSASGFCKEVSWSLLGCGQFSLVHGSSIPPLCEHSAIALHVWHMRCWPTDYFSLISNPPDRSGHLKRIGRFVVRFRDPNAYQLAGFWKGHAELLGNFAVKGIVTAKNYIAFWLEDRARATVFTDSLHKVSLLCNRRYSISPDAASNHTAEQFIYATLTRKTRVEDRREDLWGALKENVWRQLPRPL